MRRSFLDSVLKGAEALAARDGAGTLPDAELLKRFGSTRDSAAFAMLVRRHGPLVWGVCRNLLPADADAEDAFQATFLALVRSANSIRKPEALAGWLHGVAYRVAMKARRSAARRKQREQKAAIPEPTSPIPDSAWDELQAAVHEEVCKLPDKLRLPFVLCGLQGRSQKEAATVLGWKVGTVSGRLTEARRRLLDRLAKRGIPAGMAVSAAVLGGVAGHAAVPSALGSKVQLLIGSTSPVSETILSLARGVTPMTLTRTKLLAAGVVLAGVLTTGVSVLSKADAQQPQKNYDERLRKYYDALRTEKATPDRWEYKFIPVDEPLTANDLQKVLAGADREGWSYCGSQELAVEKAGKVRPHMVFKRPRAGAVTDAGPRFADVTREAGLNEREREAAALKALQDDKALREKLARDQEDKARDLLERARQQEAGLARQRAEAEKAQADAQQALRMAKEKADAEAAAHAAEQSRAKELETMKAQFEAAIRKMEAELKAKRALTAPANPTKPDQPKVDPNTPVSAVVSLKHIDGKSAVAALHRVLPDAHIVSQVNSDSVRLSGPLNLVTKGREAIQNADEPPWAKTPADPVEAQVFRLKFAKAEEAVKVLAKTFPTGKFVADPTTNSVVAAGPAALLKDVKKVIADLDTSRE